MIRHAGSSAADLRTTLILLCEDGSLRIYMANVDHTNFWMVPTMQPGVGLAVDGGTAKLERKKKLTQTGLCVFSCVRCVDCDLSSTGAFALFLFSRTSFSVSHGRLGDRNYIHVL